MAPQDIARATSQSHEDVWRELRPPLEHRFVAIDPANGQECLVEGFYRAAESVPRNATQCSRVKMAERTGIHLNPRHL